MKYIVIKPGWDTAELNHPQTPRVNEEIIVFGKTHTIIKVDGDTVYVKG